MRDTYLKAKSNVLDKRNKELEQDKNLQIELIHEEFYQNELNFVLTTQFKHKQVQVLIIFI